ncbi:hypothetical protein [Leifsonia shinshuensis]
MHTSELLAIVRAADIPNPGPTAPPGLSGLASLIIGWVEWGGIILGVLAIAVAGITLAWQRRHPEGGTGNLGDIMKVVLGIGIVVSAVGIVTAIISAVAS